ncbi:hypothetical protein BT96DRAFT_1052407 [Gymnopus androsaceus JB14]|uniref:Mitochondrial DNA polymerase catalytic subunit n=1 Tax=Gymnopus androsaceus JB14 TaxID=1447944 RepID=A0A6A4H645_9AGAR|nr:hypothetical protein BT96DRAFT_1052407 [Gymnopus androsaceus JB14]
MQRLSFKRDARNKGQVYTGGLFGLARHINYGGYVLWRAGFATAAAGCGLVIAGFFTFDFLKRGILELDEYCGKRYAQAWTHKREPRIERYNALKFLDLPIGEGDFRPDDPANVALLPTAVKKGLKTGTALGRPHSLPLLQDGSMTSCDVDLALQLSRGDKGEDVKSAVLWIAESAYRKDQASVADDPWLSQLDWAEVEVDGDGAPKPKTKKPKTEKPPPVYWPKWYWDLTKPKKGMPLGSLDITIRNRNSPLLLKMSWQGFPLFYSREHGWIFRVPPSSSPSFSKVLQAHKDGESANVGSPLSKSFLKFAMDGVLKSSAGDELKELVDVGAQCSYWISARDRILNQVVIWDDKTSASSSMGFPSNATEQSEEELETQQKELTEIAAALGLDFAETPHAKKWGIILPQVITMGTVTRRAIEKTWLTASNAKKNRVGSELKSMVRAPPGYAIVGADVDSEELWISSCMGTKVAGTDLHSKTASILGILRDQAKVFNYSRIFGAGMRHAMLLLQQGNSKMTQEEAQKLAGNLYASTKGKNTHRNDIFDRKFWYGGTESYLFNKLEEIALPEKPQTPALGCGVTHALQKDCLPAGFGSDYMPSRINWVVQSSGVDYLHLLIVSMDHLIRKYNIGARYLISVHDELRYLVKEEDRFRAVLALQIANLWTRSMFAYKLGLDDLPQGVAFFSAVDVDKVLRKEVDMPCVTPSHPIPIPPGESLGIGDVLTRTNGGSLWADGKPMELNNNNSASWEGSLDGYSEVDCLTHRANNAAFLRAQATSDFSEVKHLARQVQGKKFEGRPGSRGDPSKTKKKSKNGKSIPVGNGEGVDWAEIVERLLREGRELMSSSILHARATSFHVITPRRTLAEIAKEERKKKEAEEAKAEAEKDKLKAEKKKKAAEKARLAEERAAREERAASGSKRKKRSSDSESDEHSDQEKDTSRQGSQSKKRKLEVRKGKSRKPKQVKAKEVDFED